MEQLPMDQLRLEGERGMEGGEVEVDDLPDVEPEDSVSRVSRRSRGSYRSKVSGTSSLSQSIVREAATKAGLKVKASFLKERQRREQEEVRCRQERELLLHRKEQEEVRSRQERELLLVEAEIAEAEAREQVLINFGEKCSRSRVSDTGRSVGYSNINPDADVFRPRRHTTDPGYGPRECGQDLRYGITPQESRHQDNERNHLRPCRPQVPFNVNNGNPTMNTTQAEANLMETLISYNLRSLMPKAEVQKFSGDVTQYDSFIRSFESIISSRLTKEEEKVYYLEQYTSGRPRELVRTCTHMAPGTGYQEARELLRKRYGNREVVATAYVNKILEWPDLKDEDVEGFDQFYTMLVGCLNALTGGSLGVQEIEHPRTMRKIIGKLPYSMQNGWRRRVDEIMLF